MPVRVHYPTQCKVIRQWLAFNEERPVGRQVEESLQGDSTCIKRSIVEMMEDELDVVIERLMSGDGAAADGRDPGRAEGLAIAISIVKQPYSPDINLARNEAMLRYEARMEEG
jgi:hypothetical protein